MNNSDNYTHEDPDYAVAGPSTNYEQRIFEETAREQTSRKIASIINRQFSEEIDAKEKEIHQVQENLDKALKTLHFLRYVIISDFYNRKQCLAKQNGVKQTRIHPAVRGATGKSPKYENYGNFSQKNTILASTKLETPMVCDFPSDKQQNSTENCKNDQSNHLASSEQCEALEIPEIIGNCGKFDNFKSSKNGEDSGHSEITKMLENSMETTSNFCDNKHLRHLQENVNFEDFKRKNAANSTNNAGNNFQLSNSRCQDSQNSNFTMPFNNEDLNKLRENSNLENFWVSHHEKSDFQEINAKNDENLPKNLEIKSNEKTEEPRRKVPRYIPPKPAEISSKLPSRGAHYKVRKRITVGNISKWIPLDWREDEASHKWTMYVRCTEDSNIADFISKVRFFLHPSYEPNNIVDVTSAPFHLSRRGWGEFPLRVQLHFKNSINKPIDIIHHLKLDKTYTGLQTLGSETVVDIWINTLSQQNLSNKVFQKNEISEVGGNNQCPLRGQNNEGNNEDVGKAGKADKQLEKFNGKFSAENNTSFFSDPNIVIKQETSDETSENGGKTSEDLHDCAIKNKKIANEEINVYSQFYIEHNYANFGFSVIKTENSSENEKNITIAHLSQQNLKNSSENLGNPENEFSSNFPTPKNGENRVNSSGKRVDLEMRIKTLQNSSAICQPLEITIPPPFIGNPQKNPIILLENNSEKIITLNTNSSQKNVSLLKKSNNLLNMKLDPSKSLILNSNSNIPILKMVEKLEIPKNCENSTQNDTKFVKNSTNKQNKKCNEKFLKTKITLGKDKTKLNSKRKFYERILMDLQRVRIPANFEAVLAFIVKRIPLVSPYFDDPDYKKLHPYVCGSDKQFFSLNLSKRKALEWYRAKSVRNVLKSRLISNEKLWGIKAIMTWCRVHGFTPTKSENSDFGSRKSKKTNENATNLEQIKGKSNKIGKKRNSQKKPSDVYGAEEFCEESSKNYGNSNNSCGEAKESTFSEEFSTHIMSSQFSDWFEENKKTTYMYLCDDKEIDVEQMEKSPEIGKNAVQEGISNPVVLEIPKCIMPMYSYTINKSSEIGIQLKFEEIVEGVVHGAAGRVLTKAVECFLEDLLRSSLQQSFNRPQTSRTPDTITEDDVRNAIHREKFQILLTKI